MTTGEAETANAPTGATPEATITATPQPEGTKHAFQADVARLLHLMVHSVYSERDIFLRELISNAADACEKLRYEAIAEPSLVQDGQPFGITIAIDKDAKTLSVSDNGVGMGEDDLIGALGSIASSGTRAFLDKLSINNAEKGDGDKPQTSQDLIGQFGIGFYSAFMVADHVEVDTRRAGADFAHRWTSDGKGAYAIAPLDLDHAPVRGTRVVLHLTPRARTTSRPTRSKASCASIPAPSPCRSTSLEKAGDEPKQPQSEGTALWVKPKSAVTAGGIQGLLSKRSPASSTSRR